MGKLLNQAATLTEILIVVGILAFLAGLAFWAFSSQIAKGNDAKRKADINRIQEAIEEYEKDHDCYPLPQLVICNPGDGLKPYLNQVPCDPVTRASYLYDHEDSTCPSWYRLYASLDNESDIDIGKVGCLDGCGPDLAFNYYGSSPNAPTPAQGGGGDGDGGGGGIPAFYGCQGGTCVPISWDPSRPGPECDPNYQNASCYGQCGSPMTECTDWNQ